MLNLSRLGFANSFVAFRGRLGFAANGLDRRIGTLIRADKVEVVPYVARSKMDKVVMSGIQPTGVMHLGNYYGAVEKWLTMQDDVFTRLYIGLADLHSISTYQDPDLLRKHIIEMTACLLACGLDYEKVAFFQQSRIPYHADLAWILSSCATTAQLNRMAQFRDKAAKYKMGDVPLGLLTYPMLQTADILLYRATHVPVGDDQKTHLALARDVAECFNSRYKIAYFPVPQVVNSGAPRLRSLRNYERKMSKSDAEQRSRIEITDSPENIRDIFKKALTDFISDVTFEPEHRPAIANLVQIHSLVTGKSPNEIVLASTGLNTAQYKMMLADLVIERFKPVRSAYLKFKDDKLFLANVLEAGNRKAIAEAEETIKDVRRIVGLDFLL